MAIEKSRDAFRTISEVAETLEVPAHVLRFWESRFTQVKPVKRAGGRRYYRRADIALLDGIRKLLHDDGLTIRGVQKMLREDGVKAVAALGRAPGDDPSETLDGSAADAEAGATGGPGEASTYDDAPMAEDVSLEAEEPRVLTFSRRGTAPHAAGEVPDGAAGTGQQPGAGAPVPAGPGGADEAPDMAGVAASEDVAAEVSASEDLMSEDAALEAQAADAPDGAGGAEDRAAAGTTAPARAIPPTPDLAPDPEDDDPAFAMPALDLSRLKADPAVLRPLYDRLVALRHDLAETKRRGPAA